MARTTLTGRPPRLVLALERRTADLRGADWPLRPLAERDALPRPAGFGRGTGV